jgi:hypothetical protein
VCLINFGVPVSRRKGYRKRSRKDTCRGQTACRPVSSHRFVSKGPSRLRLYGDNRINTKTRSGEQYVTERKQHQKPLRIAAQLQRPTSRPCEIWASGSRRPAGSLRGRGASCGLQQAAEIAANAPDAKAPERGCAGEDGESLSTDA